jgi:hypothetical protein
MKSIDLCVSRFDEDTKIAFLDLYTKVDSGAQLDYGQPDVSEETPEELNDY